MDKKLIANFVCRHRHKAFVFDENDNKILIKNEHFKGAFDGDTVEISIIDDKKLIGRVTKVIERKKNGYLGIFKYYKKNKGLIQLKNNNIIVETKKRGLKPNTLVLVELDYTTLVGKYDNIRANVVHSFGKFDKEEAIYESLLFSSDIPLFFSKEVKDEAIKIKATGLEAEYANRVDLRDKFTITIDDITAKDLDDAIYLEKHENGYTLYVSIADVSFFVKANSKLDEEAQKRGNSVYLVDRVIPMLPKRLSNVLCSLNPNEDKLCFTIKLDYNLKGKLLKTDYFKSVIRSHRRCTYNEVNEIFEKNIRQGNEMLFDMLELSTMVRNKKLKNGMINFDIPEIKLLLDDKGNIKEIRKRVSGLAENLIEDFMVEANCAVAETLFWQEIPAIYRVHEEPDLETLSTLNQKLNILGYNIPNVAEIHSGKIAKIIEKSANDENSYLIHKTILRAMKRAIYSPTNEGHFGLGLKYYLHFTSPIRRYSDLIVHRILAGEKVSLKDLKYISKHISKTERIAEKLEKDTVKLKLLTYMKHNIGKEYTATISGMLSNKVFLQLDNLVEVVFYPNIKGDFYILDSEKIVSIHGNESYSIGKKVKVVIEEIDYEKIEIIGEVPYENASK